MVMKALVLGGTGLVSTGIVRQLVARGVQVSVFNRGLRVSSAESGDSSAKAKAAVPEFRATIGLEAGARETFADLRRRGAWADSAADTAYQAMVDHALTLGFPVEEA